MIIALKHCMIRARFCARELTTTMDDQETLLDKRMQAKKAKEAGTEEVKKTVVPDGTGK